MSRQEVYEFNKKKYGTGFIGTTVTGKEFEVQQYNGNTDIIVNLVGSSYPFKTSVSAIENGKVQDPFRKSCIAFDNPKYEFSIGSCFRTNQGCLVQIIDYINTKEIYIKFLDEFGYECKVYAQNLRKGEVRNPYFKNEFGGYLGVGPYNGNEFMWLYRIWYNMLIRTRADQNYYRKHHIGVDAYDEVDICEEWLCFNTFAEWYMDELKDLNPGLTYDVEKDILNKVNGYKGYVGEDDYIVYQKIYSPQTCCLIPHDLNIAFEVRAFKSNFPTDISFQRYKTNHDNKLHQMAEYYYSIHAISPYVYKVLSTWETKYSDLR